VPPDCLGKLRPHDAINLDRELSEMFSNSSVPPRFFVLKQAGGVCGLGCYTTSWMQYGVFEISWINVDSCHRGKGFGTLLVSRILEELRDKRAHTVLLFASKAVSLYERLGFVRLTQCGGDWLMALKTDQPVHAFLA
jgi:ribosomal protein S18 acetylase RimI-like enzyme